MCTLFVKCKYKEDFFAALLSIQDKPEKYIPALRKEGIKLLPPDINKSDKYFSVDLESKDILFGLGSIKNVGDKKMPTIISNRPYKSLDDIIDRVPKSIFNKKVAESLIQVGAFDNIENGSRNKILNTFATIRKIKDHEVLDEEINLDEYATYEKKLLGSSVSKIPYWETISNKENINEEAIITSIFTKTDKKGNLMLFATLLINGSDVESLMFSSNYSSINMTLELNKKYRITGKKDTDKLIINSITDETIPVIKYR